MMTHNLAAYHKIKSKSKAAKCLRMNSNLKKKKYVNLSIMNLWSNNTKLTLTCYVSDIEQLRKLGPKCTYPIDEVSMTRCEGCHQHYHVQCQKDFTFSLQQSKDVENFWLFDPCTSAIMHIG